MRHPIRVLAGGTVAVSATTVARWNVFATARGKWYSERSTGPQFVPQDVRMSKRRSRSAPRYSLVIETLENRIVLSGSNSASALHRGAIKVVRQTARTET